MFKMLTTPNILAAYLYRQMGEQMPAPILNADGEIDVEADNAVLSAWSADTDSFEVSRVRLQQFIAQTMLLLTDLEELVIDNAEPAPAQYMTLFYDAAKMTFDQDKSQLRTYFMWLYYVLYGRPEGSRWGDMVDVMGVEAFTAMVRERFANLVGQAYN
jgi:lysyl-tRNA synthetase class I